MAKKNEVIIRVKFNESTVLMFGNSYKTWEFQLDEYLWHLKQLGQLISFENVTVSDNAWIGWGGLKWCPEEDFQHQLNREGCQSNDPDNPNARQYNDMIFYKDGTVTKKVKKMFENYNANTY